jgi:hypothetical protein
VGYERPIRVALVCAIAAVLCAPVASAQDPLLDEFSKCELWYQALDQPGSTIVACDQAQLDHFIASGLTDPGPGGARVDGPEGRVDIDQVPVTYSSEDPRGLRRVRVTGSGSATGVYAMAFDPRGVIRAATFAPTALPKDTPLRVTWNRSTAALIGPDGKAVVTAPVQTRHVARFRMLAMPRGVRAHRTGSRAVISWRARPGLVYGITSGPSFGAARSNFLVFRTSEHRVTVRLPKGHRWIGVRAYSNDAFSRIVRVRVR